METPDELLNMALDMEEDITRQVDVPGALVDSVSEAGGLVDSVSNVVHINQMTTDQKANFNLEVPGFDWKAMLQMAKPNVNTCISNC